LIEKRLTNAKDKSQLALIAAVDPEVSGQKRKAGKRKPGKPRPFAPKRDNNWNDEIASFLAMTNSYE